MGRHREARRSEAGTTLVELLVTIVILGIAFSTLIGGTFTAVATSDRQRKQTVADGVLRSFAEAVKAAPYDAGCSTAAYAANGYTPPPSYTPTVVSCGALDNAALPGVQLLRLQVVSVDGRATETIDVVKRP